MNKFGSNWTAMAVLALGLGLGSSANAYWTFGSGSTVAADGTGVSITGISGAYAANGGTLASGATGTAIVAAGTACSQTQCGTTNNTNTYGISGFAASGTAWVAGDSASQLQYYSGGKGMASDSTSGTAPNHALDNGPSTNSSDLINGRGNTEAILVSFSSSVVLSSIGIGWKSGDADISLFRYTGSSAPSLNGVLASGVTNMLNAGWELVGNYGDLAVDTTNPYNAVNASGKGSSWWLISAYNSSYGSATTGAVDQGNDFFKVYAVAGSKCTGGGGTCGGGGSGGSVPEPSTIALAALGLVGAFGIRRRVGRTGG
jgi:hypothetical protein